MKILTLLMLWCWIADGQHDFYDPRSASMGRIKSVQEGEYALFATPAGIASLERWHIGALYHQAFGLKELTSLAIGLAIPGRIPLGIGVEQFGDINFKTQRFGFTFAGKMGPLKVGLTSNFWLFSIPGYQEDHAFSWDLGIQIPLDTKLQLAFVFQNPARTKVFREESLSSIMQVGGNYLFHEFLDLAVEIMYTLGKGWGGKLGLEYLVKGRLPLRTGIDLLHKTAHAGLGFRHNRWSIDYALDLHVNLGVSHQAALYLHWS